MLVDFNLAVSTPTVTPSNLIPCQIFPGIVYATAAVTIQWIGLLDWTTGVVETALI